MKIHVSPNPADRVRMRTDGPPVPIYRSEDASPPRDESFLAMSHRRLPWLLLVAAGAVLFGSLLGHALAAEPFAQQAKPSNEVPQVSPIER